MKIAVIGDWHLTDNDRSVKAVQVWQWLLNSIGHSGADAVAGIGDLTATGSAEQCAAVRDFFRELALPVYLTPGNAEYRTDGRAAEEQTLLPPPEMPFFLLDSANYAPDTGVLGAVADGAQKLLLTHIPPDRWPEPARQDLERAQARQAVAAVLAGHTHVESSLTLRGLDPDKTIGGAPTWELWDNDSGNWRRRVFTMPGVDPSEWSAGERREWLDRLGVSAMYEPVPVITAAIEYGIPALELRANSLTPENDEEVRRLLEQWRENGGKNLSLHLTNLTIDNPERLQASAAAAVALGCDRVTIHVPKITAAAYAANKERLAGNLLEATAELRRRRIVIGIENLHTVPGATADEQRNFGCNIGECREWIEYVNILSGGREDFTFHLDIGHARNDAPFSAVENLSDYYAELGAITSGIHLHQVTVLPDGTMDNHTVMNEPYGRLISLGGLFLAWRFRQFPRKPPLFLEIRGDGNGLKSWLALRKYFV